MSEHEEPSARRPYNAAADFVDANVARGNGKKVSFKEKDRALTYGELQAASCRFGRGLEKLGLRHEGLIVLLHLDTIEFPVAFWGAIRAGVIPIPLNTLLTPEQYAYMIDDSRAEAILISPQLVNSILPILDRLTWLKLAIVTGADKKMPKIGRLKGARFGEEVGAGAGR